jgi:hypothetical protein
MRYLNNAYSRGSTVGIATATSWTTGGSEFGFKSSQEFSLSHIVQTNFGAHSNSYSMGTGDFFPACKAAGQEADNLSQAAVEVKKTLIHTFIPS